MNAVIFLSEINEKETIKNVRVYFDKEFPRLIELSQFGRMQLSSMKLTDTQVTSSKINNQEIGMIRSINAKEIVQETVKAILNCSEPYSTLLKGIYIDNLRNIDVQRRIGYGSTRYSELKNKALLCFADRFYTVKDLHVYVNSNISDPLKG